MISQAETCSTGHIALPLRPGDIHPNEMLTLEVVDGRGGRLTYELIVVEPKDLPLPPADIPSQWLVAAWRLAAGPPDTRLDSIARLQTAPPDTLAAPSHFRSGLERLEALTAPRRRASPTADPSRVHTSNVVLRTFGVPNDPQRHRILRFDLVVRADQLRRHPLRALLLSDVETPLLISAGVAMPNSFELIASILSDRQS